MDGYRNLAKNLETLKGKGKNEAGLCNFEKGKEYYEYLVGSNVGSDMSIAEIKKTTEEFIDTRMSAIFDTLYDDMCNIGCHNFLIISKRLKKHIFI